MLTLKLISEETERVVKGLEKKHFPNAREAVEKVLEYDKIRREAQQKLDNNKQQANQFAKQIGALMKEGKKEEAESAKAQVAMLKADAKALEEIKAGKVEYRLDKTNIIHVPIGKASFTEEQLNENFQTLIDAIIKAKPAAAKGQYIRSATLTSTMGPGVKLNPARF